MQTEEQDLERGQDDSSLRSVRAEVLRCQGEKPTPLTFYSSLNFITGRFHSLYLVKIIKIFAINVYLPSSVSRLSGIKVNGQNETRKLAGKRKVSPTFSIYEHRRPTKEHETE